MKTSTVLITGLLLSSLAAPAWENSANHAAAAFSRLKTLVGNWEADTQMGKAHLSYELVAGGTTLLERAWGDRMPVMLTMYHIDGDRLLLTHYCMKGNQPRMQAAAYDAGAGEIDFRFLDATNLTDPSAGHMHNAKIRFGGEGQFSTEWQFYEDGKPKFTESVRYTRVR